MLCLFIHSSGHSMLNLYFFFFLRDHVFVKVWKLLLHVSVSIYIDEAQTFNYLLITRAAKTKLSCQDCWVLFYYGDIYQEQMIFHGTMCFNNSGAF